MSDKKKDDEVFDEEEQDLHFSSDDDDEAELSCQTGLDGAELQNTALASWINQSGGTAYVRVQWAYGGVTNFRLQNGQTHALHARTRAPWDYYCWSRRGSPNRCGNPHRVRAGRRHVMR